LKIPQVEDAKYLGLYLDHKLNWEKHIFTKQKQFRLQLGKIYWLLGSKSQLSAENKLLLYRQFSNLFGLWRLIMGYGLQFEYSNITKIHTKTNILKLPTLWYVINDILH
jgi:hypothetical protein